MDSDLYDIWLTGLQSGQSIEQITNALAKAFRKDPAQIADLLSRAPMVVKHGQTGDVAAKYQALIQRSGATCELRLAESTVSLKSIPLKPSLVTTDASPRSADERTTLAINQLPVYFEPSPDILFPKRCVRCFAERPTRSVSILPMATDDEPVSNFAGQAAGFMFFGYIGAAVGGMVQASLREAGEESRTAGLVKEYQIPLCESCDEVLAGPVDSSFAAHQQPWTPVPFLDIQYTGEYTQLTLKHPYFAEAFLLLNQGLVRGNTWGISNLSGALPALGFSDRITQYASYIRMGGDGAPLKERLQGHLRSHWNSMALAVAPDIHRKVEFAARRACGGLALSVSILAVLNCLDGYLVFSPEGLYLGRGPEEPRHCIGWSDLILPIMGENSASLDFGEGLVVPWRQADFPVVEVLALLESIRLGLIPEDGSIPGASPLPDGLWEIDAGRGPITSLADLLGRHRSLLGLYVSSDIPSAKKKVALERCGVASSSILALIDCTVGGSAKDFVLIGEDYIYIRQGSTTNVSIPLGDTATWEVSSSGIFNIRFSGYGDIAISKRKDYLELFRRIHQYTGCRLPKEHQETDAREETAGERDDKVENRPTSLEEILQGYRDLSNFHIAPDIPLKMASNALNLCGGLPSTLLALFDCTVFGSAKKCILICRDSVKLYFGPQDNVAIPLADFVSCRISVTHGSRVQFSDYGSGVILNPANEMRRILRLFKEIQEFAERDPFMGPSSS